MRITLVERTYVVSNKPLLILLFIPTFLNISFTNSLLIPEFLNHSQLHRFTTIYYTLKQPPPQTPTEVNPALKKTLTLMTKQPKSADDYVKSAFPKGIEACF